MLKSTRSITEALAPSELILREDGSVYHLGVRGEHLADRIIVVGDPDRVDLIAKYFDKVLFTHSTREFAVQTGELNGQLLTVLSTGIGVDNIDIVLNELDAAVNLDPDTRMPKSELRQLSILRLGTSGSLSDKAPIGSFVGSHLAIGMEGLPYHYEPQFESEEIELARQFKSHMQWPEKLSDPYFVRSGSILRELFAEQVVPGLTLTANGFYAPQGRSLRLGVGMKDYHDKLRNFQSGQLELTNFEMECSGIYALAGMLGHDAFTICAILADRTGKAFHPDPPKAIKELIEMALVRLTSI